MIDFTVQCGFLAGLVPVRQRVIGYEGNRVAVLHHDGGSHCLVVAVAPTHTLVLTSVTRAGV